MNPAPQPAAGITPSYARTRFGP
jgi:nicotinamidase-related amidase